MYEMKPEYYTGIAQIDEEHKKLFEIADEAYELYKNEFIPMSCHAARMRSCGRTSMTTSLRF